MDERQACARLKSRFEAAGFQIQQNRMFDEAGVRFEMDGFDPQRRVGYEYVTREAGDGWDVDSNVVAALADRMKRGELYVLVVDEARAPDAAAIDRIVTEFFAELKQRSVIPVKPAGAAPAAAPAAKAPGPKPVATKPGPPKEAPKPPAPTPPAPAVAKAPAGKKPPPTPAKKSKPKR